MKNTCLFVVIAFNQNKLTSKCIKNFKRFLPLNFKLMLFDNGSSSNMKRIAVKEKVLYIRSETNLGFAGGWNFAIKNILAKQGLTSYKALCLLNNDVFINKKFSNQINKHLITFLKNKKIAAFTPLLYKDALFKIVENFGILYYRSGLAFENINIQRKNNILLNGAFLFLKRSICMELIKKDGFIFIPEFFFNAEDIELSLRLVSRGNQILVNHSLEAQHLGGQTKNSNEKNIFFGWRNLLWIILISRNWRNLIIDLPFLFIGQCFLFLSSYRSKHFFVLPKYYYDTIKKIPLLFRLRKIYSSNRIPKEYILNGVLPKEYFLRIFRPDSKSIKVDQN